MIRVPSVSLALVLLGVSTFPVLAREIVNFPAANFVLGHNNFTSDGVTDPPNASSLADACMVIVDPVSGKVFVSDTENNRVLRYANRDTLLNGAPAEYVFGQANLTSKVNTVPPTATSLKAPTGLALDSSGRLWVADASNHRVLRYSSATTRADPSPAADRVLGQANFVSDTVLALPSQSSMDSPFGLLLDSAGRLWVADFGNNRVLRFDNASGLNNGDPADGLLGQVSFLGKAPGTGAASFNEPIALAVDAGGTLWVADRGNDRVLGFPGAAAAANGIAATRVLGQADPSFTGPGLSAGRLSGPSGVFVDSRDRLWVLDQANNRAIRFQGASTIANGAAATLVVGQPDFTSNADIIDSRHFAGSFMGIFVDHRESLWISDQTRRRVLRFDAVVTRKPVVTIKGPRRVTTKSGSLKIVGKASADTSVARVFVANGPVGFVVRGTERWKSRVRLLPGRNLIKATAFDTEGKRSRPARLAVTRG